MNSSDIGSPFDSSPTPIQEDLQTLKDRISEDPEIIEALQDLIHCLEHSWTPESEKLAWQGYTDRIKYLILRAKSHREENWEHA